MRNVAIGDEIDVTRGDGKHFRYRADASRIVRFDASGIRPVKPHYKLVLSTCWPFDAVTSGPDRYILHATLIETGSQDVHHAFSDRAQMPQPHASSQ